MSKMMYIAKNTKTCDYVSTDNIGKSDLESIADFTNIRANANSKKLLCNEQAPFVCIFCGKPVYYRRKSKKNDATFCHYATENECSGKVRSIILKKILLQMFADNAMHKSGGLRMKNCSSDIMMFPDKQLSFRGSTVFAHAYKDGIQWSDWETILNGDSPDDVIRRVKAPITMQRGSEYIFICFDDNKSGVVQDLISEGVYCTLFKIYWRDDISMSNLTQVFKDIKDGRNESYIYLVMSPRIYFYNKAKFFAQTDSSVVCPASRGTHIVNTEDCINCPCLYSHDATKVECFGRLAISSSALLSSNNIFDKFTDKAVSERFDVLIHDDTNQKSIGGDSRVSSNVFGMCEECGEPYELRGSLNMKPVSGIKKMNIYGRGLILNCSSCGAYKRLKCHCGSQIVPYINRQNGVVFVGCEDRDYSNSGAFPCNTNSLSLFTSESCEHLAEEIIVAGNLDLWAQGKNAILKRLAEHFPRYRKEESE